MKIIAILEDNFAVGGGFPQALNATLQMQKICSGRFEFEVLAGRKSDFAFLRSLGIEARPFSISIFDRLLQKLGGNPWWRHLQIRLKLVGGFERALLARGCDLVYFTKPSYLPGVLQQLNFITTLFDLCHRDAAEFPEVRAFSEFQARERYCRTYLTGAITVLTDSPALAAAAERRYGLDRERLLAMPFAPAASLDASVSSGKSLVLGKYGLAEGYLFYPAQFWAHKNHIRILQALKALKERGRILHAVFAGGDQGNLRHVEAFAARHALQAQVRFLGFVPAEDLRGLYEGCAAVVMPTYFGPTNLPPLEAWTVGKPLVYSTQCAEQAGDAALCVDPDDAEGLAQAIVKVLDPAVAASLVALGAARLKHIARERADAEAELLRRLQAFDARRKCWA